VDPEPGKEALQPLGRRQVGQAEHDLEHPQPDQLVRRQDDGSTLVADGDPVAPAKQRAEVAAQGEADSRGPGPADSKPGPDATKAAGGRESRRA
jgi:hypothetical protein